MKQIKFEQHFLSVALHFKFLWGHGDKKWSNLWKRGDCSLNQGCENSSSNKCTTSKGTLYLLVFIIKKYSVYSHYITKDNYLKHCSASWAQKTPIARPPSLHWTSASIPSFSTWSSNSSWQSLVAVHRLVLFSVHVKLCRWMFPGREEMEIRGSVCVPLSNWSISFLSIPHHVNRPIKYTI